MSIIIEGDRHIKRKEPYFSALSLYSNWILEQDWNNKANSFMSVGDLFDTASPTPSEYKLIIKFIQESKFKKIYILAGNHDYSRTKEQFSLMPLEEFSNVEIIYREKALEINGVNLLMLPYFYPHLHEDVTTMEEYYGNLHNTPLGKKQYDYILGHLYMEDMFGSHCDIMNLKGHIIAGHDHIARAVNDRAEYIGVPLPTRISDKGQEFHLIELNESGKNYISIPKFIEYREVSYPDPLPETDSPFTIWDIKNVVSAETAKELYGKASDQLFIRELSYRKEVHDNNNDEPKEESFSLKDYFEDFCSDRNIPSDVKNIILNYL